MNRSRLALAFVAGAAVGVLAAAAPVAAHIDADPAEIPAGVPVTVGFTVEHGCGDADTTGLLFQVPPGVTDLAGIEQPGWAVSGDAETVQFTGGPLDHDTAATFELTFTAPAIAGRLDFPMVQQCGDTELRWIEIAAEGAPEPEHPAPRVDVVGEPPATTVTVSETTATAAPVEATTTTGSPTTIASTSTTEQTVIAPAPDTTVTPSESSGDDDGDDGDGGSAVSPWLVVVGVLVIGAAGAGIAVLVTKRRAAPGGPEPK